MSVKDTAKKQYVRIVDRAAQQLRDLHKPSNGWLAVLRKALGMSGAQVAKRMGVSRNAIHQAERNERDGAITLNQMHKIAEAMGGRFVYAVVPDGSVDDIIHIQANQKATALIQKASAHMALESQSLSPKQIEQRIEDLANELVRDLPSDFWEAK